MDLFGIEAGGDEGRKRDKGKERKREKGKERRGGGEESLRARTLGTEIIDLIDQNGKSSDQNK
jgi:hypothetical protein